ncbi:MAG TPA: translation elongation factor Ts [Casimicrobiaceae bacterium]|nr:translation elongation factor Ts [Casimicrobiaceae bacterium]
MADISASRVMELRQRTGLGMMECKKALTEAAGDIAKAEEILRVKSGAKASKAADRIAAEGVIGLNVAADGKIGALVELNCETDFVAKNDEFKAYAAQLAAVVAHSNPADVAALAAQSLPDGKPVETRRVELVQKIGENMTIRRFSRLVAKGRIASYVHGGKIGVLVDVTGGDDTLGKDIAMHIAASKPLAIDRTGVASEVVERERSIASQRAAESGKPANIVEKMIEGAVSKYLAEVTLLSQPFVKNDKQTVQQLLKERNASVNGFVLFVVGEGIEKRKDDFADEVKRMSQPRAGEDGAAMA